MVKLTAQEITDRIQKMGMGETISIKDFKVYKSPRGYKVTSGKKTEFFQRGATVAKVLNEQLNVKPLATASTTTPVVKPKRKRGGAIGVMVVLVLEILMIAFYAFSIISSYEVPIVGETLGTYLPYVLLGLVGFFGLVATLTSRNRVSKVVLTINLFLLVAMIGWMGKGLVHVMMDDLAFTPMWEYLSTHSLFYMAVVLVVVLLSNLFKIKKKK